MPPSTSLAGKTNSSSSTPPGPDGTNVVSLIAWGGVGKTALITEWVQARFIDKQWKTGDYQPALAAYFDWTFYDQGTSARTGSVGDFFEQALDFFGDPDPNLPGKGGRLADLIRQQRSLIILDGIEPLQYPPGSTSQAGHLLDPDLNELLRALAIGNPGLCIITSRQALTDLHGLRRSVHVEHDLEDLPVPIATRLLRQFQIKGTDQELADASEKFGCHALSLTLLGRYLCDAHDGDIRRIDQINLHRADTLTREDRHRTAWRVLETYESWLATAQADSNPTTLAILRLTGLFDRTATAGCLAALRAEPIIPGLTDSLCGMENDEWNILLKRLERAHLIKLRESTNLGSQIADQSSIDAHPLIREYFAQQLKQIQPEAFKAAHSRLFDHLCATTEYRPDTLIGLQPLYQAVMHGCLAARQQDVCENIYIARINRGFGQDGFFSTRKLGAFDSDLAAVANFFEDESWARVSPSIKESHIAWLFNAAGYRLRALGRLEEALKPTQISCGMDEAEKDLDGAARSISNLSQLEVDLGHLSDAVVDSHRAIYFADRHREAFQRIISRATAASALHQSGQRVEAQRFFVEAETIQAGDQPEFPLLYSLSGFRYAELLLSQAEFLAWQTCVAPSFGDLRREISNGLRTLEAEVFANCAEIILRAKKLHEWQSPSDPPLDIALNNLTHTRALLYQALPMRFDQPKSRTLDSKTKIAISYLRQANQVQFLPLALLTAAFYHGTLGENLEEAERLLDEAQQIAERGPMPLYLADVHLHRARLFGRPKGTASAKPRSESSGRNEDLETPEPHRGLCGPHSFPHIDPKAELAEARRLIEKHGYWRRREELEDAEAAAVSW
jgi:tetratricopeptide (TPR) repeat protein